MSSSHPADSSDRPSALRARRLPYRWSGRLRTPPGRPASGSAVRRAAGGRTPLRLTRRGRLVVAAGRLLLTRAALVLVGLLAVLRSRGRVRRSRRRAVRGRCLWYWQWCCLARRSGGGRAVAPEADPRDAVPGSWRLNALTARHVGRGWATARGASRSLRGSGSARPALGLGGRITRIRALSRLASGTVGQAYGNPTSSSYTDVSHPHVVPRLIHRFARLVHRSSPAVVHRGRGDARLSVAAWQTAESEPPGRTDALPVLPQRRLPGRRLAQQPTTAPRSAAAGSARVRPPVHHRRDGQPDRGQALRRHRAVQPGEGRLRRAQGLPGAAGQRGRPRAAGPAGRGDVRADRLRPRSTRTRWAWPSSARCASWTRSPTCASPASTGRSSPSRTSRLRSPLLRVERDTRRAQDPSPAGSPSHRRRRRRGRQRRRRSPVHRASAPASRPHGRT